MFQHESAAAGGKAMTGKKMGKDQHEHRKGRNGNGK
jgi:hypothetical protein